MTITEVANGIFKGVDDNVISLQSILKKIYTGTATEEDYSYYREHLMSAEEKAIGKPIYEMTPDETLKYQAMTSNNEQGDLQGYDCKLCRNKGEIYKADGGYLSVEICSCMSIRKTAKRMRDSGMGDLLNLYSFKNYVQSEPWQKHIYNTAQGFLKNEGRNWFFLGGQNGSGKSMICTALVNEFLQRGVPAKYMLWVDDSTELKQCITDKELYNPKIRELKEVQCLYIDDLFKGGISKADIKLAFEILNYRYNKARSDRAKRYITIISSELSVEEIMKVPEMEAIGGRIYEMTKPQYYLYVQPDPNKNYRMR